MDFDLAGAVIERALEDVRGERPLGDVHSHALDILDGGHPSPVWDQLRSVDADGDVASATAWLRGIVETHAPPADLAAVWFGLYELSETSDLSDVVPAIGLSGGTTYPDDDWIFEQDWAPPGHLAAPGLGGLARPTVGHDDSDLHWLVTYALVFAYATGLTGEVLRGAGGRALLAGRDNLGAAVGFHDGDIVLLGNLGPSGLDTSDQGWT